MFRLVLIGLAVLALLVYLPRLFQRNTAFEELLLLCRNDTEQAERLIQHAHARCPGINRREATHRALNAYKRDLGR